MYLDVKGLCTCAIGNLIDPLPLGLPFTKQDGTQATEAEISAEWHAVKARQDLRMRGGMAYGAITVLRLTKAAVGEIVLGKLAQVDAYLAHRWRAWETFPDDVQLAVLSMAWACGPAFHFPKFEAALLAGDWAECARECHMDETGNPGLKPRNAANVALFRSAASTIVPADDQPVFLLPDI